MTPTPSLSVALVSAVFQDEASWGSLEGVLREARDAGAALAVLPELPLNPWSPAGREARDDDAEPTGGPRAAAQAAAARASGIALVGGAIVRDDDGVRRNTALVFDAAGGLVAAYAKGHLPQEPGFWETDHYAAGDRGPDVIDALGVPFGLQICSDVNRPQGCQLIRAQGGAAAIAPRATERATYERWRPVFLANAITNAMYVLSVNRPSAEAGVEIGGPSIGVGPDGAVLVETEDRIAVVTLERAAVERARRAYPGYLPVRSSMYAAAWAQCADADGYTS